MLDNLSQPTQEALELLSVVVHVSVYHQLNALQLQGILHAL